MHAFFNVKSVSLKRIHFILVVTSMKCIRFYETDIISQRVMNTEREILKATNNLQLFSRQCKAKVAGEASAKVEKKK